MEFACAALSKYFKKMFRAYKIIAYPKFFHQQKISVTLLGEI
jgi:hypothetical protein